MARMHSRKKGISKSRKPSQEKPHWSTYSPAQVEKLVVKYRKSSKSSSEIGMILRDSYGIASVKAICDKKIAAILDEQKLSSKLPEDILALIGKLVDIMAHMDKKKKDMTAKRGRELTISKLRRLTKYYLRTKRLEEGFKLDYKRLKMYLE